MRPKVFFMLILFIAGVAVFGLAIKQKDGTLAKANTTQNQEATSQVSAFQTQTESMGAVEIEVTPVAIQTGKETIFNVVLSTHSVNLDYDFSSIFQLVDDQGQTYQVSSWTGGQGGHHLTGELTFDPMLYEAKKVTLIVTGIDNQTSELIWEL